MLWKVLAITTAATVSRSSTLLSPRCGGGVGRSASMLAQPHNENARAARTKVLCRIGLLLFRHWRGDPQWHADAKMRAGEFAIDDFHGALVHIDEFIDYRE